MGLSLLADRPNHNVCVTHVVRYTRCALHTLCVTHVVRYTLCVTPVVRYTLCVRHVVRYTRCALDTLCVTLYGESHRSALSDDDDDVNKGSVYISVCV